MPPAGYDAHDGLLGIALVSAVVWGAGYVARRNEGLATVLALQYAQLAALTALVALVASQLALRGVAAAFFLPLAWSVLRTAREHSRDRTRLSREKQRVLAAIDAMNRDYGFLDWLTIKAVQLLLVLTVAMWPMRIVAATVALVALTAGMRSLVRLRSRPEEVES